jgi:hypothetical protein
MLDPVAANIAVWILGLYSVACTLTLIATAWLYRNR